MSETITIEQVKNWLLNKRKTVLEGCDNPHCPFCLDVKEKHGMVEHIFDGYLLGDLSSLTDSGKVTKL